MAAHASTAEGMRRAALAGVETIEHGDGGTPEVFRLMAERKVALCPTLAAGDAIAQYGGWKKGVDAEPARLTQKRATFQAALDAGVTILSGSDVGVFAHGDNARELALMVDYGMSPLDALKSATSVRRARAAPGRSTRPRRARACWPTWSPSTATPPRDISALGRVRLVMKAGVVHRRSVAQSHEELSHRGTEITELLVTSAPVPARLGLTAGAPGSPRTLCLCASVARSLWLLAGIQ